jgi:hypothetical protein
MHTTISCRIGVAGGGHRRDVSIQPVDLYVFIIQALTGTLSGSGVNADFSVRGS